MTWNGPTPSREKREENQEPCVASSAQRSSGKVGEREMIRSLVAPQISSVQEESAVQSKWHAMESSGDTAELYQKIQQVCGKCPQKNNKT